MATNARTLLEPYIAGPAGGKNGDHPMQCPLHEDTVRSATVNFPKRIWWCGVCGGGKLSELIATRNDWHEPTVGDGSHGGSSSPQTGRKSVLPTEERLDGYRTRLQSEPEAMKYLLEKRGLSEATIISRGLGYNAGTGKYVVPIYNLDGDLHNVRYHKPGGKPKWVNTPGYGSPATLHPVDVIESSDDLVWCEGEFDSYLTTQMGLPAFTATGGAKIVWQEEWNELLKGKRIILCFDSDFEGRNAVHRVMPHLKECTESVQIARLPFPMERKHGKDITDWWLEGGTPSNFARLISSVKAQAPAHDFEEIDYESMHNDGILNKPVAVKATVSTIEGPFLLMPKKVDAVCSMDWKPATCNLCPLGPKGKSGQHGYKVTPTDDLNLNLLHKRNTTVELELKRHCGVPLKCPVVEFDWESRSAWHGEVRNGSNLASDSLPILLFKRTPPQMGTSIELHGEVKHTPKQYSVFVASNSRAVETELDRFQLTQEQADDIRGLMSALPSDPRPALDELALRSEDHITKRFGLRWLHICTDLVYHSVLSFHFQDEIVKRGWLELLAVGESRVGKSTSVAALAEWYGKGEIVPCEKISIPGLVSTTEKRSGGRGDNWVARVGKLPLLDKQLIVLDEAQGLKAEQIGQLSDARSAGIIKVTQASVIDTTARVRMIWLANPRTNNQRGITALKRLMGATEDLARIDLPMYIRSGRMDDSEYDRWQNPASRVSTPLDRAVAQNLMYWAWSRKPRDVKWHPGSIARVVEIAETMAEKYASDTPLMPEYEAKVRVARLAVAIAARLFSTDSTGRHVRVLKKHVSAAGWVYANLLKNPDLEYMTEVSDKNLSDESGRLYGRELRELVQENPWLKGFLTESDPGTRSVGQLMGTDSQYFLRKLVGWGAIESNEASWKVPDWARKIAQETRTF